ncbi:MAG TPA: sulfatase-like hydrolase/transferase [Myxococcota bacterium]|nr:sulfatase-like hydrolase/transferase [Myxococcota bacterium]
MKMRIALTLSLALTLAGCRWLRGERKHSEGDEKTTEKSVDKATEKSPDKAERSDEKVARDEVEDEGAEGEAKGDGKPLVLFIVMDTVRADHLSMCGYDRPTSPKLDELSKKGKVAYTCDAHAPGPWTVPSHASYFTGLSVPEHGSDAMGIRFSQDIPTLAELMDKQGYQPVLLSANPTLSKVSGLQRGYEKIRVTKKLTEMRGEEVRKELRKLLGEVDPRKAMFLTVNLIDAHDPYPRIPADVGWVPAQDEMVYDVHDKKKDTPYHHYFLGGMDEAAQRSYEEQARNGYDYGISLADQNVGEVMRVLRQEGWLKNGFRLVITSDHGEFLGEHHLLRHGCYVWEPVTKVPFLYYDSAATEKITLPSPMSSLYAFWLLKDGKLPDPLPPVESFSNRREFDIKKGSDMAALWTSGNEKLVWDTDRFLRFDLAADPGEAAGQPLPADHPQRALLEKMASDHQAHLAVVRKQDVDPALRDELKELGYWEDPASPSPATSP